MKMLYLRQDNLRKHNGLGQPNLFMATSIFITTFAQAFITTYFSAVTLSE